MQKIGRNFFLTVALPLMFLTVVCAEERISISEVEVSAGTAAVVLNGSLRINDILAISSGTVETWQLPKGVEIVQPELQERVTTALNTGVADKEKISRIAYQITDIEPILPADSLARAKAVVVFNEALNVTATVMNNNKGLWILWPENFKITNAVLRKIVDKSILNKYKK